MNPDQKPQKQTRRPAKMSGAMIACITVIALVVGYIAGTRSYEIEAVVGPLFGRHISADTIDLRRTEEVYRLLKANFDGDLDSTKLSEGAAAGLVAAADDPHTTYLNAEQAAEFDRQLKGEVSGIGAEIGVRNDQPTILRVISNSPAERAGVKAGDVIVSVDDKLTNKADATTTADLIRGDADTKVKLILMRERTAKEFTITRAKVTDPSVGSSVEDGVGIIRIRRFDSDTGTLARAAAEKLKDSGVHGVILDLRDNPGGYLEQSQQVAGLWLDHKLVVTERRGGTQTDALDATGLPVLAGIKTVVLVNKGSASASEIVAGALKDHKVATLIGETTYGKGTVQQVMSLADGAQLKVTIAHWYTPNGVNITKKGIDPDKKVELSLEDLNAGRDPQLQEAMKAF